MDENFIYQKIADSIRAEILEGIWAPGDKLPTVRKLTETWHCTPGTVQRAYKILAQQGLIISRAGQGTHVADQVEVHEINPLRRATLINRAEIFFLEALSSGYKQDEIELALRMALDRWRVVQLETPVKIENSIQFAGSNDLAVSWIASNFPEIVPKYHLVLQFGGSLSGLIALAEGKAEIAGCHLWDEEDQDYNRAYVERVLPGKKVALVTMSHRQLGLIVPKGNPQKVHSLNDLVKPEVKFINRQSGSGTRVWLDSRLRDMHVKTSLISGYQNEKSSHSDIARMIVEGKATVGIGLQAAAYAYDLEFIPLTREKYEFAIPEENLMQPAIKRFVEWLASEAAKEAIGSLSGYDPLHSGQVRWIY